MYSSVKFFEPTTIFGPAAGLAAAVDAASSAAVKAESRPTIMTERHFFLLIPCPPRHAWAASRTEGGSSSGTRPESMRRPRGVSSRCRPAKEKSAPKESADTMIDAPTTPERKYDG